MIPYGRQDITDADVRSVEEVLRSDFLTQGPAIPLFETAVATRVKVAHAVAVNSATSALHVACGALGVGPGDWLWTVPNTFVASANCGRYMGASVDFVDIEPTTWNMSVAALEEKLKRAEEEMRLPKVVVPVHFSGQATDQERIWELAQAYGFRILEDASHSIGASRHGEPVGSCCWSDITVFSFHPVKIVTTGEGGMGLTNDAGLAERMRLLRNHGITRDCARFVGRGADTGAAGSGQDTPGAWYYEQQQLGFNYRITDIQAVLGLSQLTRLEQYVARRNELAVRYGRGLAGLPLQLPTISIGNRSSWHLYVVRVKSEETRRQVFDALRAAGVGVNVHYMPVHLQPYYRGLGFKPGQFPESEAYGRSAITLPLYPTLTNDEQDRVIRTLTEVLRNL